MKRVSRRELATVITRQLIDGKDQQQVMRELAAYLVDTKMTAQADMVIGDIAEALQALQGHVSAEVTSAFALTDATLATIRSFVQEMTHAKTVELTTREDTSLIGGVVIQTPGHEFDASVRRKINKLGLAQDGALRPQVSASRAAVPHVPLRSDAQPENGLHHPETSPNKTAAIGEA